MYRTSFDLKTILEKTKEQSEAKHDVILQLKMFNQFLKLVYVYVLISVHDKKNVKKCKNVKYM